jgi:hypothetical protein
MRSTVENISSSRMVIILEVSSRTASATARGFQLNNENNCQGNWSGSGIMYRLSSNSYNGYEIERLKSRLRKYIFVSSDLYEDEFKDNNRKNRGVSPGSGHVLQKNMAEP